jgi:hypothetical protein
MAPDLRHDWIKRYIRGRCTSIPYWLSVTDAYFVQDYIEECRPNRIVIMSYGAHKVPQLGRDLTNMFQNNQLQRRRTGLGNMHSMGFPSWVWEYTL